MLQTLTTNFFHAQIIMHPRYNEDSVANNDVALLRLKIPLSLPIGNNRIAPICLPSRSMFNNEEAELAGFGITMVSKAYLR